MPDTTHATRDDLLACLQELGIETETHEHPPVFTVGEAQAHCSHLPGGHCKNLFLKDKKKKLWLIVTLDEQSVDLNALSKALGAPRFSFGKAELLAEVLGVIPGAVTPLALINDTKLRVNVVLDSAMMSLDLLNYHPLSNDATTAITPAGLLALLASFGHEPRLFDFAAMT
jgi:Ala-tRNA(Pro) deacylase